MYYSVKADYDNMVKYYLMAIEKNNSHAMHNLGFYYEKIKNYDNALKYYLMAIEHGDDNATTTLLSLQCNNPEIAEKMIEIMINSQNKVDKLEEEMKELLQENVKLKNV